MEKGILSVLGVLKRRALPAVITLAAVIGGAVAYLQVTPRLYQTSARLILDEKQVSVSDLGRDLTQQPNGTPGGPSPLANQAELIKSRPILKEAVQKVFPQLPNNSVAQNEAVTKLYSGLKVSIVPATNILEVSYQDSNPVLATKIVNAVSEVMEQESTNFVRREAASVRQFLQQEVPKQKLVLQQAEVAENNYRQISGIVSLDDQTKSLVNSLATLKDEERTLSTALAEATTQENSLEKITEAGSPQNAYASVRSGQDEQLKTLRAKLTDLHTQLIAARLRFTDGNPTVIDLIEQEKAVRNLYQQELARVASSNQSAGSKAATDQISQELSSKLINTQVERKAISDKLKLVRFQAHNLQANLAGIPIRQQPLTALTRQRQEAADSLKLLESKLEEARIAEAQLVGNIRIVQEATLPSSPASPRQLSVLVIAIVFGSVLATGVILLLEVMDNTLKDASEAEELLKLPLLGVLPRLSSQTLILAPAERFLDDIGLVEPYRMLFKTLEFRSSDRLRLIVVSSTISGEGKSQVASHLAAVSAMLSRRTLIIDADLHRPVQHTLFNLAPRPGITDVIDGERSLLQAVQPTGIENLSILTCGELRGRPSQLLESAAMKSLMVEAAANYDLVIVDTPPLSASADAATLSQHDGVMLVTRPGITNKEILQKGVSELTGNHIPILGVVVNDMTSQTDKYYRDPINSSQSNRRLTAR